MTRSTRQRLMIGVGVIALLALINPSYSSAYIDGPNGVVKMEKFGFGPGRMYVYTRVVADDQTVTVEMK